MSNTRTATKNPPLQRSSALDDAHWFAEEIHAHEGQLKAWLRGQFPSVRDVDDLVQESYLRIWRAKALHPIDSAKSFLFKVARHLALDHVRKARNAPFAPSEETAASRVLDHGPTAAEAALSSDALRHLADAVVDLPTHYRSVIILHKIRGLSQKQVAAQLNLSERSVEKYVQRGLARCETFLRERGLDGLNL